MDNDNLKHYAYLKVLDNLLKLSKEDEKIVDLFSVYVSSNNDYAYNGTYLQDSVQPFREAIESFQHKKCMIETFRKKLSNKYHSLEQWYIVFDNVFVITENLQMFLLIDLSHDNKISEHLKEYIKAFNFFKQDSKNILIKYVKFNETEISVDIQKEYVMIEKTNSELELFSLVQKDLDFNTKKAEDCNESD